MESATSQYEVCFQKITVTPLCPSPETTAIGAPHPVIPLIQDISTSWFYRFLCIFPPPGYTAFYAFFLSAYFLLLAALDVLHCTVFLQLSILYSCLSFVHCRIQRYATYQPQTGTRKIFLKLELDTEFCPNPWKGTPFQTRLSVLTGHFWFEFWINWAFQHIFHHFKTSEKNNSKDLQSICNVTLYKYNGQVCHIHYPAEGKGFSGCSDVKYNVIV